MRANRKKNKVKQAVILCGGFGSRLGKITKNTPKPLLKVNNKPFIEYLFNFFFRFGIKEIFLLCHFKSNKFFRKYHNQRLNNVIVKCINEKNKLGTGGAIKNSLKYFDNYFYVSNGDTLFDINLLDLNYGKSINKKYSYIALSNKKLKQRYGKVETKGKFVKNFYSKKKNSFAYSGICLINRSSLTNIRKKVYNLEKDLFSYLIKKNKLKYKLYEKQFLDIGTTAYLNRASRFLKKINFKGAVFLDRDGVINKDFGYVYKKNNFIWKKNVGRAIKFLNDNNYYVFVITNQSGIGRGYYSEKDVNDLHSWVNEKLNLQGAHIDEFVYAPYFKKSKKYSSKIEFRRRKPNVGMIEELSKKWSINFKKSFLIGDSDTDIISGQKKKIYSYKLKSNDDLLDVVKRIYIQKK